MCTRSGEKQLATKPELESRNPLKLIPILGALILISLVIHDDDDDDDADDDDDDDDDDDYDDDANIMIIR